MDLTGGMRLAVQHRMRAYYSAIVAGAALVVSAFLPWMFLGDMPIGGVPDTAGFWILGLGLAAIVLASLSIVTRKNSRHPLLLVGLLSAGILFLARLWMERALVEGAWARAQAIAIVENVAPLEQAAPTVGFGIYLGLAASVVLVVFGLTIVVKRVPAPYAASEDDDV